VKPAGSLPAGTPWTELQSFRALAGAAPPVHGQLGDAVLRNAILIREVENKFLSLFAEGLMNGTVHTCVGQEFSALAIAGQLRQDDWVTSNHRCHGHFIAKTGRWQALIDELMGLASGVCRGIGSSQHLFAPGFLSNGPQAALVPVGTGIALRQRAARRGAICASFVGEGTFGEGVLYEAMNLASLWSVPQLFVCENNLYSQSTPQHDGLSGSIRGRAEAFGIRYFEGDTWNPVDLFKVAAEAIEFARATRRPALLNVRTYRLNAHSKSDDDRDPEEVKFFRDHDPLNRLLALPAWKEVQSRVRAEIDAHIASSPRAVLSAGQYLTDQLPREPRRDARDLQNEKIRMVQALNRAYGEALANGAHLLGEDVLDPYGGAFKVTKGLSSRFPGQVLTTPISEAGIVGVGIGLSLLGVPTFVEIMFGDFVTHVFDQLISNASKFFHMYAFQASVPVRIRTPMGGKRGYGPTHSQSLEKHLLGIDNVAVLALTSLTDPHGAIAALSDLPGPAVIIESKVDYGRFLWQGNPDYRAQQDSPGLGSVVLSPLRREPTVTVLAYGETARDIADNLKRIFDESDCVVELIVPLLLHPFDLRPLLDSVTRTQRLVVVEEGSVAFGIGAEVIAQLCERGAVVPCSRIGAEPVPIPSIAALEKQLLPSSDKLIEFLRPH
jgi:2-oxoisovalerate dehydrogenase E1 component